MLVKDVLKKIGINSSDMRSVKGVSFDSRNIKDGYIFVAYKGEKVDGNDYIYEAFSNGAVCVVSDRLVGYDIYCCNNISKAKEVLIKSIYKLNKVKLIGITGTNGKTSTAHLLYQSLNNIGVKSAYIGTLGVIDNEYSRILDNTTPDMDVLAQEISMAIKRKTKYVIMEVSSHSLSMNRVAPFNFEIIGFSNLSQDHLDYYQNMENYFLAKKLLFDNAKKQTIGVINNQDSYSKRIIKDFKGKVVEYGDNYQIVKNDIHGLGFFIDNIFIESPLIYKTNISNLLMVYTILVELGIDREIISKAIKKCAPIKGRMEVLYNNEFSIILDYAHTPDAMERIIKETNSIKKGRCIVLFGCGGNRDKTKRPIMGKIASTLADKIYITNDNPRNENENKIIEDILSGIANNDKIKVEINRERAIQLAISELEKDDILLVLGKGHEDYQIIKNKKYHLSDREIVNSCLEA